MSSSPLVAIADDFSGAAEIAGVAHAEGLNVYLTRFPGLEFPDSSDVIVIDSDTRRKSTSDSVSIHQDITRDLDPPPTHFYKKTDSVLRGHILAELDALKVGFKRSRVLFCPANPSRQRVITEGRYTIDSIPLHQTEFAKDPNFPASTDIVLDLLMKNSNWKDTTVISIPDIETQDDLDSIASQIDSQTLAAGASPFFASYLQFLEQSSDRRLTNPPKLDDSLLFVSGSCSHESKRFALEFRRKGWPVIALHPEHDSQPELEKLPQSRISLLKLTDAPLENPSDLPHFLAASLQNIPLPKHILIEGGDTAAAILQKFEWQNFNVLHQWEPGITTLQPQHSNAPLLTIKPGSYPWPDELINI